MKLATCLDYGTSSPISARVPPPSELFGRQSSFTIMNYGPKSVLTAADRTDLRRLYQGVWRREIEKNERDSHSLGETIQRDDASGPQLRAVAWIGVRSNRRRRRSKRWPSASGK